jgi:hypothetical protein
MYPMIISLVLETLYCDNATQYPLEYRVVQDFAGSTQRWSKLCKQARGRVGSNSSTSIKTAL